eukprot:2774163-Pleurochrysis_carterae.AAC.1
MSRPNRLNGLSHSGSARACHQDRISKHRILFPDQFDGSRIRRQSGCETLPRHVRTHLCEAARKHTAYAECHPAKRCALPRGRRHDGSAAERESDLHAENVLEASMPSQSASISYQAKHETQFRCSYERGRMPYIVCHYILPVLHV